MNRVELSGPEQEHIHENRTPFIETLKHRLGDSPDIIYRDIVYGNNSVLLVYVEGMADPKSLIDGMLENVDVAASSKEESPEQAYERLKKQGIAMGRVRDTDHYTELISALLAGGSIIFVEGHSICLLVGTESLNQRGVEEASSQSVVRGPREGFTESLRNNTALVRRRIQSPMVRIEQRRLGEQTRTSIAIMYMEGMADEEVLSELRTRLDQIQLPSVLESSYIEEMIQDRRYSPFPTIFNSERPDVIASAILEGRVAILMEGTPFVLIVPSLFVQAFQSSEDYYQRADFASLVRLLRYFCFVLALLTPSFYIAITTFHQEMIPTNLLISLIGQREGVPFPAFVEALIMEITFEILREAGIRLPKSIGQSVSIVGTLVIGQAAVDAGLVSAAMVIVVAITAIANFALPAFNLGISVRILRFLLMAIAASFGLYGIMISLIIIALHLCSLQSLGVPYMSSLAPLKRNSQKDTLLRLSQRMVKKHFREN
ncbi:spore germination protein [Paenibacillus apis]|uniref:Spore germination protein KA n=1 Tax=Paenibacillus apis TaxID=1792174 RepID=A0A919Y116_9BACL|nr:spore germination protein [Paenibacillus apis]GIO40470.1 spore germination protein KA [Paenibacillus apis]